MASGNCNVWRYTPRITGLELQASKPVMGKKEDGFVNFPSFGIFAQWRCVSLNFVLDDVHISV